ncbi:sentrin-specific protease 7b isoform X2 [Salminus brasiliensis]|uniref:sentrin-specific protease 7b isoform X2 n=1 Tax=Salminus brasiliensis TaxID=930266 RepID=UPI003B837BCF
MGSPFKIPKKTQPSDSSSVLMMSPLSRVPDGDTSKASWTQAGFNGRRPHKSSSANGRTDGSSGPAGGDRSVLSPSHRSEVRGHARVNGIPAKEAGGTPKASRTPGGDLTDQNRWRPKRASDTLCPHEGGKDTPAVKKQWGTGFPETWNSSQVENEEEEEEDDEDGGRTKKASSPAKEASARSLRSTPLESKAVCLKGNGQRARPPSDQPSKEEVPQKRVRSPGERAAVSMSLRKAGSDLSYSRRRLRLSLAFKTYQRVKPSSTEPIVLSSDDDDDDDDEEEEGGSNVGRSDALSAQKAGPNPSAGGGQKSGDAEAPSTMELAFSTLHFGSTCSHANGPIVITEERISIPLKDGEDGVAVAVVPSELHNYGVWDGALAGDGTLLSISQQPSPSLLFLILSDAQTRLLHTELSAIHNTHTACQSGPFLLVTLAGQMDELQSALLASLMDVIGLRYGRPFLGVSLSWAEGLNRLHLHPRGSHLLTLLGQGDGVDGGQRTEGERTDEAIPAGTTTSRAGGGGKSSEATGTRHSSLRSYTRQQSLPRRLIQYPPPPSKGGITVTSEDLECLRDGEFLNDVIIDFYLKYLQLERADQDVANRSHIFSSFFYKQLTRKDNSSEEEAGGTAQYRRHRRVKTWTRHVDIFSKDFLFIPVNQEAHWYLVVICFPGLLQAESVPWKCLTSAGASGTMQKPQPQASGRPGGQGRALSTGQRQTGSTDGPKRQSHDLPDCTVLNCQREKVTRRPCILIMDSLKLSYHHRIYTLLRDYLQVEWEVRRGTPRAFGENSIRGCHCKVPLQDNSSDCGLYLLQYVESFLQNPVVHFEFPLRLERWFPRQQVRRKREELRELVLQLYRRQGGGAEQGSG